MTRRDEVESTRRETERNSPAGERGDTTHGPDAGDAGGGGDRAPLADLVDRVDERREREPSRRFDETKLFADRSTPTSAHDESWDHGGAVGASPSTATDGASPSTDGPSDGDDESAVVPKRSYCEQCRFLSAPPDVHCTNEGTEILEFVDAGHVRVSSCPIVEERGDVGDGPVA